MIILRWRIEGRHVGRKPLDLNRIGILRNRSQGQSLGQLAKSYRVSRATIHRVVCQPASGLEKHSATGVSEGLENQASQPQ
jgi:hypothetical protein